MPDADPTGADPSPDDLDLHLRLDATARLAAGVERLAALMEGRIAPALERIAAAVERLEVPGGQAGAPDPRRAAVAEVHEALRERAWGRVAELVEMLSRDHPDHPETSAVADLVARRKGEAVGTLREQLVASRGTNDTESVLVLRDELVLLLDPAERQELDQDLVRWLLKAIQRRMRTGTVAADVARLAAEVAGRFGATLEGASLRASLPTLRRSAGLCPRCGEPYAGVEDACPRCLPGVGENAVVPPITPAPPEAPGPVPPP